LKLHNIEKSITIRIKIMAVKIRLSRIGKKGRPFYRIVAVDSREKRDGRYLENLGTFDPVNKELVQYHQDKVQRWISVGAQCSGAAEKLVKMWSKKA